MEIKIFKSGDEASLAVAKVISDLVAEKPNAGLGLATGSSPVGIYKHLVKMYEDGGLDFSGVKTFNLDEYCETNPDDEHSYRKFMDDNLFKLINVKEGNINIPDGTCDAVEACAKYNKLLDDNQIDLQLLGIGTNGHIAFNEPGTSFDSITHKVELTDSTREANKVFFNGDKDKVPTHAISMGLANIIKAKKICLIAIGEAKQDAIYELVNGEVREEMPASILKKHQNVMLFLDEAAAGKLNKS